MKRQVAASIWLGLGVSTLTGCMMPAPSGERLSSILPTSPDEAATESAANDRAVRASLAAEHDDVARLPAVSRGARAALIAPDASLSAAAAALSANDRETPVDWSQAPAEPYPSTGAPRPELPDSQALADHQPADAAADEASPPAESGSPAPEDAADALQAALAQHSEPPQQQAEPAPAADAPDSAPASDAPADQPQRVLAQRSDPQDAPAPTWYREHAPSWLEQAARAGYWKANRAAQLTSGEADGDDSLAANATASPEAAAPPLGDSQSLVRQASAEEFGDDAGAVSPAAWPPPAEATPQAAPALSVAELLRQAAQQAAARSQAAELQADERRRLQRIQSLLVAMSAESPEAAQIPLEHESESWRSLRTAVYWLLDADAANDVQALQALRSSVRRLAEEAPLELQQLAFCTRVESFGRYQPFASRTFYPDQELLLYAEVENFGVVAGEQGFATELQGGYTIADEAGRLVASHDFAVDRQVSRQRRRDCFVAYRMYLPRDIRPGNYKLTLTVQDAAGGKSGQIAADLVIAGPDWNASK